MKKTTIVKNVCLAVIIFSVLQGLGGIIMSGVLYAINPEYKEALADGNSDAAMTIAPPEALGLTVILSGLLTCLILWLMKIIRLPEALDGTGIRWGAAFLALVGAVAGVCSMDLVSEQLNLPDLMGEQFMAMANNVWGILGIAVVGPIVEELVFREGIQGTMERGGVKPWIAIVVSALCFGLIHFNPAQIPFAFGMGIILSLIYHKTGNVVVTSLIHILNNSLAVVEMRLLGEHAEDFSYAESLDLSPVSVWIVIAVLGVACILLLRKYWLTQAIDN